MKNYEAMKKSAQSAEDERLENGHRWPEVDQCDWFDTSSGPEYEYLCSVNPAVVLEMIAEIERLNLVEAVWKLQKHMPTAVIECLELIEKLETENECLRASLGA